MSKVILLNGSPRADGCTAAALDEMVKVFSEEGIETEVIQVGSKSIRGCIACNYCETHGHCVFNDLVTEVSNPEAGNRLQAEGESMALAGLNMLPSAMPKFETEGLEKCIEVMEQKDVKGAKSFYDDYMTMMTAYSRELNVQYHRQQMEKEGWDAGKEKTYLNELRLEHQKSIEAFDKLWENQQLIMLPVVRNGKQASVGYQPDIWKGWE